MTWKTRTKNTNSRSRLLLYIVWSIQTTKTHRNFFIKHHHNKLSLRFAKNCLNNQNFSKLFPLNSQKHVMKVRNPQKYRVNKANTERYKCSSIPYLQRLLNVESKKRKNDMNDLVSELSKAKKRKCKWTMSVLLTITFENKAHYYYYYYY